MRFHAAAFACLVVVSATAHASEPIARPPRPDKLAAGPLEPLNYFIGDWTIDATWAWGNRLRGRNEYRVGLQGQFLEVATIVQDNDGPVYERYYSFYTYDAQSESFVAMGLNSDGSTSSMPHTLEVVNDLPVMAFDTENPDGSRLRQRFEAIDQDNCAWTVWLTRAGETTEQQIMDGRWERVTQDDPWMSAAAALTAGPHDITSSTFAASGADVRSFTTTADIGAPITDVYNAWSTVEGWKSVYGGGPGEANIDLAIGGRYEWLFNGSVGSNGCQVLSYIPNRMISFTWSAPPSQPESRLMRTWVVVELSELNGAGTRVTLTHLGFGEGADWDETFNYFQSAWDRVLGTMKTSLEEWGD